MENVNGKLNIVQGISGGYLPKLLRSIARINKSQLKKFFLRSQAKKGDNVAAVALARKVYHIAPSADEWRDISE